MTSAKVLWDDLAARFSQTNVPRLFQLKKDLASLTQGTKSINSYFTEFRGLMDELDTLSPIPRCNCPITQQLDKYEQLNKLSNFLMGLSEQFVPIRGQILLMKPLPDLGQAYVMLVQEEQQRDFTKGTNTLTESMALNVRINSAANVQKDKSKLQKKQSDSANVQCDYCHLSGHSRDKCFALHGYPDWHRLHGQPKPKVKIDNSNKANAVTANEHNRTQTSASIADACTGLDSSLSNQQCYQIINMLQNRLNTGSTSGTINSTNIAGPSANASCLQVASPPLLSQVVLKLLLLLVILMFGL